MNATSQRFELPSASRTQRRFKPSLASAVLEALETRRLFSLPGGLADADVGAPTGGSATYSAPTFSVTGAGSDLFGSADGFHYVYQTLAGDGSVTARVTGITANGGHSLAGLDIRSSLTASSANLFIAQRDDGGIFVNARGQDGQSGVNLANNIAGSFPEYLRITRSGDTITAATSTNGTSFTSVFSTNINLTATAYVGMAVASQTGTSPTAFATFTNYVAQGSADTTPPTATLTNAPNPAGTQTVPYRFTVQYNDNSLVDASTIASGNILVTGPGGYSQSATLVSTGLTNSGRVDAVYSVSGLSTLGAYQVNMVANQVADSSGNHVASGNLGTFTLTTDTQPPTATLSSAPVDTHLGTGNYSFTVTYNDNGDIQAASLGNSNITVTGPGGYSHAATLTSTGLSDGNTIVATYSVPSPATQGTYTVSVTATVQDVSGNVISPGAIGTFQAAPANAYIYGNVSRTTGAGLSGQHLFLDLNNSGSYVASDPTATTDSSGNYFFSGLAPGLYHVRLYAGFNKIVTPSTGEIDETVNTSAVVSGVNFVVSLPTAYIYGSVTAYTGNSPLAGQHLFIDLNNSGSYVPGDPTATTDSSGNFFFSGITAGNYIVREYTPPGTGVAVPSAGYASVTVAEGQVVSGVVFKNATASAYIYGNVASSNGAGLANQHVFIDLNNSGGYVPGDPAATTDASGNFFFSGILPGSYVVRLYAPPGTTIASPASGAITTSVNEAQVVSGLSFRFA